MSVDPLPLPNSLWANTATPAPQTDELKGNQEAEIVIVGGGFTGLSSALHLAELGKNVIVLEACDIGFGASGRNGGQVNPGLKLGPDQLAKIFGRERAKSIFKETEQSADLVFDLVEKHGIDCHLTRSGFLFASESKKALAASTARVRWLNEAGISAEMLDTEETARRIGNSIYRGALYDPRGGALQPLSYARGLAKAAIQYGAQVFTNSAVTQIQRDNDQWLLKTRSGSVKANTVLLCTNGYSDFAGSETLWSGLSRSVIPVYSFQIATKPLGDNIQKTIIPSGHTVSDTRKLMFYYRYDHQGRLLIGGRGSMNDRTDIEGYTHLIRKVSELFPQLQSPEVEFFWGGKIAITMDGLPHIHNLAPGVFAGLGFNGRGVAMASLMGKWLAEGVTNGFSENCLPASTLKPIPFHRWRKPAIHLAKIGKALQDRLGV